MTVSAGYGVSAAVQQTALYWGDVTPTPGKLGELWMDTTGGSQTLKTSTSLNPIVWTAIGSGSAAPVDATYLTLSLNGTLTNERVLTAGTNISFVDGGAGSTLTINASGGSTPAFLSFAKFGTD